MKALRTLLFHPRQLASALLVFGVLALAAEAVPQTQKLPETTDPSVAPEVAARLDEGLAEADRLRAAWRLDEALHRYEAIVTDARAANARRHLAAALWGRGRVQGFQSTREAAKASHEQALAIYRELSDVPGEAMASRYLGMNLLQLAEYDTARKMLDRAVELYTQLGDVAGLATTYNNLVYVAERSPEKDSIRDLAFRYAREAGDKSAECSVTHEWGDELFQAGDFIQAKQKLTVALACFESIGELSDAGRVLTSLGRLQRAHGQLGSAMDHYQRALEMQLRYHAAGNWGPRGPDPLGIVQSYNAIAVTYTYMGHFVEARTYYEKALERAREIKSELTINFLLGQLGGYYLGLAEFEKAAALLEPTLTQTQRAGNLPIRLRQLSDAYAGLGDLDRAFDLAERAVTEARNTGVDQLLHALGQRSEVLRKRKQFEAAERDLREGIAAIEDMRAKTIPMDFMKRGFMEMHQMMFAEQIELLAQQGRWQLALETAEQARARAFLDLLASREATGTQARREPPAPAIARGQLARLQPPPISGALRPLASRATLAARAGAGPHLINELSLYWKPGVSWGPAPDATWRFRGGALAAAAAGWPRAAERADYAPQASSIESSRSAQPATIAEMIATARRLKSTLLTYWVAPAGTFAWVISPRGEVNATRIDVPSMKLDTIVAQAAEATKNTAVGGLGVGSASQTRPWRELYGLLIKPLRQYLPTGDNGLLTIVPHGPLFRVSFAALQDEKGQYLIERYRVHYTPAVGVLNFTARAKSAAPRQALLVGDPGELKAESGEAMPALPWARKEVAEIAGMLPAGAPQLLVDAEASEATVRAKLEGMDLIHFATHGVIQQQRSLTSYLALRGGGDSAAQSGAATPSLVDASNDGRLTAEEVYSLQLRARLVVLSACSTALGPMTGDGVIGFTRAFLYAGASSVIATEWDVPDEAGYELMRRFYQARSRHMTTAGTESVALRSAQIGVIQALRKGTFKVTTSSGDVALPEHPLFWAGFVLVGEP